MNLSITTLESSPPHDVGPASVRFLLEASHGAKFSVIEMHAAAGFSGPPMPHHHTREEASFLVLEGSLAVTVGGRDVALPTGAFAHIPIGVDFMWRNASTSAPVRFLCVYAPAGLEQMFRDIEGAFAARGGPPTPASMREVMPPSWQKYGIALAE